MEKKFAALIPPNSKIVLELVGEDLNIANDSKLKEYFLRINPDCDYIVTDTLDIKSNQADVIVFDSSSFATLPLKKVTALINKATEHLKDEGVAIFLLENLSYADNIMALLNGDAPTVRATMIFEELSKAIDDSKLFMMKTLHSTRETKVKSAILEIANVELNITHFVACAVKKKIVPKLQSTIIQTYLGEVLVCAGIRVNDPNDFMATRPGVYISNTQSGEQLALSNNNKYNNKIFINQRVSADNLENGIKLFETISSQNYLFIEEMDDNPILWRKKYEDTQCINFVGVHAVQTSTKPLANIFKQFNPNVKIFENQLKELPPPRNFAEEIAKRQPITIFFGALNRDNDFYEILPALNKITAEYGENILVKVIAKTELFNKIETPNKVFIGKREVYNGQYVPYDIYEQELRTTHISLLPLRDNVFNRSKSDLKFIESAGSGSVVLASPTVYSNTVKDGETGFIYHNVEEFYNKLKILINNQNKRCEMAEKAYDYVKHNRLLSQHYEERWDWYNELLAKLPELNKETRKRIEILKDKGYEAFGTLGNVDEKVDVFNN